MPANGDSLAAAKAEARAQHHEMITSPVILGAFGLITRRPRLCFSLSLFVGILSIVYSHFNYHTHKFDSVGKFKAWKAMHNDVIDILERDFEQNAMQNSIVSAVILWCDGCNLMDPSRRATLQSLRAGVEGGLAAASRAEACRVWGLRWPGIIVAQDGTAAAVPVLKSSLGTDSTSLCLQALQEELRPFDKKHDGIRVALGDQTALTIASLSHGAKELFKHVMYLVPILAILLILITGSISRAITPFIAMAFTQGFARSVSLIVGKFYVDFDMTLPDDLCTFCFMALSIDYALFFWTRFSQERRRNRDPGAYVDAVMMTLKTSGIVIFLSVLALLLVYIGTAFFPYMNASGQMKICVQMIAGLAVLGVYSLVIPASLAVLLPQLYEEPEGDDVYFFGICFPRLGKGIASVSFVTKYFTHYSSFITRSPWILVVPAVIYLCFVPFLYTLAGASHNYNVVEGAVAKSIPEYSAFQVYMHRFPVSRMMPIPVLLSLTKVDEVDEGLHSKSSGSHGVSQDASSMLQHVLGSTRGQGGFSDTMSVELQEALLHFSPKDKRSDPLEISNPAMPSMQPRIHGDAVGDWRRNTSKPALTKEFQTMACNFMEQVVAATKGTRYQITGSQLDSFWWNSTSGHCATDLDMVSDDKRLLISHDGMSQVVHMYPSFPVMSFAAQDATRLLWNRIEPKLTGRIMISRNTYDFRVRHISPVGMQMLMESDYCKVAPLIMVLTAAATCLLFGSLFRSVGICFKVVLTVILPIAAEYGILVGAFEFGWFEWAGLPATEGGVAWLIFFLAMNFLFALAVDYDMFLFARVYEHRHCGWDNQSAVILALQETGPVITVAGTIMVISFACFMLSEQFVIQQTGFLYFIGLVIDTYIVRPFVAPAMLCISEKANYWPSYVPPATKSLPGVGLAHDEKMQSGASEK